MTEHCIGPRCQHCGVKVIAPEFGGAQQFECQANVPFREVGVEGEPRVLERARKNRYHFSTTTCLGKMEPKNQEVT